MEADAQLVLLTQDADLEDAPLTGGRVVTSRVLLGTSYTESSGAWVRALQALMADSSPDASVLEVTPRGELRVFQD